MRRRQKWFQKSNTDDKSQGRAETKRSGAMAEVLRKAIPAKEPTVYSSDWETSDLPCQDTDDEMDKYLDDVDTPTMEDVTCIHCDCFFTEDTGRRVGAKPIYFKGGQFVYLQICLRDILFFPKVF